MEMYRVVDKAGATVDFLLTARRDCKAALRFLRKAIGRHGVPEKITIDKSGANTAAIVRYNVDHDTISRYARSSISTMSLNRIIELSSEWSERPEPVGVRSMVFTNVSETSSNLTLSHELPMSLLTQAWARRKRGLLQTEQ